MNEGQPDRRAEHGYQRVARAGLLCLILCALGPEVHGSSGATGMIDPGPSPDTCIVKVENLTPLDIRLRVNDVRYDVKPYRTWSGHVKIGSVGLFAEGYRNQELVKVFDSIQQTCDAPQPVRGLPPLPNVVAWTLHN